MAQENLLLRQPGVYFIEDGPSHPRANRDAMIKKSKREHNFHP